MGVMPGDSPPPRERTFACWRCSAPRYAAGCAFLAKFQKRRNPMRKKLNTMLEDPFQTGI